MKKAALFLAVAFAGMPVLAFADDAAPAAAPAATAPAAADSDLDKIVCRKGEPVTGSRIPGHSICHTQRMWDQMSRDAQGMTSQMQMNGTLHNPQSN